MNLRFEAVLALSVILAACGGNQPATSETQGTAPGTSNTQPTTQKTALVRYINAIPSSNSAQNQTDLWFGDMKAFSNVAYKQVTPYMAVPAESHDFKLQTAGNTQPTALATTDKGLDAGHYYTIVAERKKDNSLTLDAIDDDLSAPDAGKAKVRVINAAVNLGGVDVIDPSGSLFQGVDDNSSTSYKQVDPVKGALEVRRSNKKTDVVRYPDLDVEAGKLYTLVIVGGESQHFDVVPVTDQTTVHTGVGD
ncbi:MAG: DUF4397 domain-containing protein [Bryobacteraceae bacterium]